MSVPVSIDVKVYFKVPYTRREEAKELNMRWNAQVKKWYILYTEDNFIDHYHKYNVPFNYEELYFTDRNKEVFDNFDFLYFEISNEHKYDYDFRTSQEKIYNFFVDC
jgi:hypothetical protein